MSSKLSLSLSSILLLGPSVFAQTTTYVWSPPNTATSPGGSNNTIPFWGKSSTYQQIHDKETMGTIATLKGLGVRPAGNRTVAGRSWDLRITLSHTATRSRTATTNFSTNLGAGNTTIAFGSATTWPTFTWKSFTTSGTKPAFTIPFKTPYIYLSALGNLCWEWRHKNGTSTAVMPMDAASGLSQKGTALASTGTGCTSTGKSAPATASFSSVPIASRAYQHDIKIGLTNGANNANAMMALTLSNTTGSVGWCAPVVTPLLLLPVKTDATGSFSFTEEMSKLSGTAPFSAYVQFGFTDTGLPGLLGLSNVAGFKTPNVPGAHGISRIYAYNRSANGLETATTGSGMTKGYGLSTAFLK